MAEYSIGNFRFISMSGAGLETPKQRLEMVVRPGVPGVALWLDALRGGPITVQTAVDCDDLGAAREEYEDYCGLIGEDPVEVVWGDEVIGAGQFAFAVLDVRLSAIRSLAFGVGGLSDDSGAWLECDWTLVAVATEE